jgi:hypothetical protein
MDNRLGGDSTCTHAFAGPVWAPGDAAYMLSVDASAARCALQLWFEPNKHMGVC